MITAIVFIIVFVITSQISFVWGVYSNKIMPQEKWGVHGTFLTALGGMIIAIFFLTIGIGAVYLIEN